MQKKEDLIHSADILNMKKWCVDDYLHDLVQSGFKWDEILILSRMFHLHVRILMENVLDMCNRQ